MTTSLKAPSAECLLVHERPVLLASPQDSAAKLLEQLADSHQENVPVVAEHGRCLAVADVPALYAHWVAHGGNLELRHISVADLALDAPKCCGPATAITDVVTLLIEDSRPVVVEQDGRFLGMIQQADVLKQLGTLSPQRACRPVATVTSRVEEILEATLALSSAIELMVRNRSQVAVLTHNDTVLAAVTATQVTTWHMLSTLLRVATDARQSASTLLQALPALVTVQPQQSVADAALQMADHNYAAVPVVNRAGHLLGVVTADRLLSLAL